MKKILLLGFLFLTYATPLLATDINVTTPGDIVQNDGFCSLREAVISANEEIFFVNPLPGECALGNGPDVILLPFNTYTLALRGLNEDRGTTGDLDIIDSVTIRGTDADRMSLIDGANIDRIFHIIRPDGNDTKKIRFENLTLAHGNPGMGSGGAVLAQFGDVTIVNCLIWENQAQTGGGILASTNLTLTNGRIEANTASMGGGIAAMASLSIRNLEVLDNIATNFAGGIYSSGTLNMEDSFVYENVANKDAGGIKLLGNANNPTLNNIVRTNIFSNQAGAAGQIGNGGGIHIQGVRLNLDLSTVNNNNALEGGGIYNAGTLNINTSTLSGNFSRDNLHNGGGLYNNGTASLLNVSFVGNHARNGGGFSSEIGSTLTLRNTLLFGNTVKFDGPDCNGRIISNDYNLVSNAINCRLEAPGSHSPGVHDILGGFDNVAPLIKVADLTLRFNGGATKTHALELASAAINAGSCTSVDGIRLESDQRGYPKGILVQNGRLFLRDECDIGAFELGAEAVLAAIQAFPNPDQLSICGDAVLSGNEICDDGNLIDEDACNNLCEVNPVGGQPQPQPQAAICGNNQVDAGEGCDDGNIADGDGCSSQCLIENANNQANPVCGNGQIEANETCDDGNLLDDDGCSAQCLVENVPPNNQVNPACGNGQVEGIETCDDGNIVAADGCDDNCQIENNQGVANPNNGGSGGGGCSLVENDFKKKSFGFPLYATILLLVTGFRLRKV